MSSTTGSEEMLDRADASFMQQKIPTLKLPPKPADSSNESKPQVAPKSPSSPLTPYLPDPPPNSPLQICPLSSTNPAHTVSALATLPRRPKKDPASQTFFPSHANTADYASLTVDRRLRKGDYDRSKAERGRIRPTPPTPPMRRLPSWVS